MRYWGDRECADPCLRTGRAPCARRRAGPPEPGLASRAVRPRPSTRMAIVGWAGGGPVSAAMRDPSHLRAQLAHLRTTTSRPLPAAAASITSSSTSSSRVAPTASQPDATPAVTPAPGAASTAEPTLLEHRPATSPLIPTPATLITLQRATDTGGPGEAMPLSKLSAVDSPGLRPGRCARLHRLHSTGQWKRVLERVETRNALMRQFSSMTSRVDARGAVRSRARSSPCPSSPRRSGSQGRWGRIPPTTRPRP